MANYENVEVAHPELKELADAVADVKGDRHARTTVKEDLEGQRRYLDKYREVSASDPIQQGWDANEPEFHAKTKIFSVMASAFEDELGTEEGRAAVKPSASASSRVSPLVTSRTRQKRSPRLSMSSWVSLPITERFFTTDTVTGVRAETARSHAGTDKS